MSSDPHSWSGTRSAFRLHKSITLTPAIIWLLIVQGFAYHVDNHSEELRKMFVTFEGKKDLVVKRPKLIPQQTTKDEWIGIVDEFVD